MMSPERLNRGIGDRLGAMASPPFFMNKTKLSIQTDSGVYEVNLPDAVFTANVPIPIPIPTPIPVPNKYVLLNCITWKPMDITPNATEYTYFVLKVDKNGNLLDGNEIAEKKFIQDIHTKGKKATFSIAGGSQNVADISNVVNFSTPRINLVNQIKNRLIWGYDGITIDIENTAIEPWVMQDFINRIRIEIGPNPVIGVYVQPYQFDTVWGQINGAKHSISWLSPMIYDFANTVDQAIELTKKWIIKVGKDKLLFGAAVNYDASGLDPIEFVKILDWINTEGLKGIGIWQNTIYTLPYQGILKTKFPNI